MTTTPTPAELPSEENVFLGVNLCKCTRVCLGHQDTKQKLEKALNEELQRQRTELLSIIDDLTDPDDCSFDHHGYCQTHGWFETDPKCPHQRSKELQPTKQQEDK